MDIGKLPLDTRRVWERLRQTPLLKGFVLIGGTALTLRIGHRVSEDLDFGYLGPILPIQRLAALRQRLQADGIDLVLNQDVAAEQDFINSGLLLEEFQQNYLAHVPEGTVKLSFVRLDNDTTALLAGTVESPLRVATTDEVFRLKSLVCADRSKTRDWFDLHTLMTKHGYDAEDFHRAFVEAGREGSFDTACMRLRGCVAHSTDEGYLRLVDAAPSLDEMRAFFGDAIDRLEVDLAAAAFRSRL